MTVQKVLVVTAACAVLVALSLMGRSWAFFCMPLWVALAAVTASLSFGITQPTPLIVVGAIAGFAGLLCADGIFPYRIFSEETFLTNTQYDQLYRSHQIQVAIYSTLAASSGGALGLLLSRLLGVAQPKCDPNSGQQGA